MGRRVPQVGCVGQRGLSPRCSPRGDLRGRRHRALPHGAHVHGAGAPAHRTADDPGKEQRGAAGSARPVASLPAQRFQSIFDAMVDPQSGEGYPVVIRLSDPPLHEFLPSYEELLVEVTRLEDKGGNEQELQKKREMLEAVGAMREMNPMLGLRGCRLGLLFPEINVMQTRAILEAALELAKEGKKLKPKIMSPLVGK